ncbi:M1 family metallopeptidase [Altericroceibacterium endophyticum]|uniref:Aminopeptidase n=1 Tax=Altericroceibacterium endophyticum TaxID=1808508 RepID=A0A6I4T7L0_9SPHN|nr:M1 family metallopeptidase [Altericroceibacterium endophyticum]MXO65840.1 M1 family peptidase [Altericroceibacterium endophyticum]
MRIIFPSLAAMLLAGCASIPANDAGQTPQLSGAPVPASIPSDLPRIARPSHYSITITPDAANLTFSGVSSVDLEVYEAADALVLSAADLDITKASLIAADGSVMEMQAALDPEKQTVSFANGETIEPGKYRLDTAYTGTINTQANGLFALDYPDKVTGEDRRGLFTQFEAPDARRFAPMFDEPIYKATFDLSAIVPADQMAVSNMPVASEKELGNGFKQVTFGTSPKMSSYLLFFGLGDFERMAKATPSGTEVGIVAPTGSGEESRYALDTLAPLVGYYNDYFGVDYPLPKLDNIAGPGQSQFFGAMENWGAVFTFERILLNDPAITSPAVRQQIYVTQAHEVAHQWFGDLVTMAWWDDLWLNEGFASWMETKATDHFNPEWQALLGRVNGREYAMGLDSFETTHPVVQKIRTVEETNQAFDAITYQKGEAVIAMLEAYAGEDIWRTGLQDYMQANKYGNTQSKDLWQAVEKAGAPGLTTIADQFTRQPGVPLVMVEGQCVNGSTKLALTQSEFSQDRREEAAANPQSWNVPLLISVGDNAPTRHILKGSTSLTLPGCGTVIVNAGQLGYFRTLYADDMRADLTKTLPDIAPIDQMGLVYDNIALAEAGYQPLGSALDMLSAVPQNADPVVARSAVGIWSDLAGYLEGEPEEAQFNALIAQKWLPRLQQLGFEPRKGEKLIDANLRSALLGTLGTLGNPEVVNAIRSRFAELKDNPQALDGPLKTTLLAVAARNASAEEWTMLANLAAKSNSAVERSTYYRLLGASKDKAIAQQALDLALTDKPGKTVSASIITSVAQNYPELAFDFIRANQDRVDELVDNAGRSRFITRVVSSSDEPTMLTKLEAYRSTLDADEAKPVDKAIAALRQRIAAAPKMRAGIKAWLAR